MTRLATGIVASAAFSGATTKVLLQLWQATAALNIAGQRLSWELRASSATNSYSLTFSTGSWPLAANNPIAMARSKRPPFFGKSAGLG